MFSSINWENKFSFFFCGCLPNHWMARFADRSMAFLWLHSIVVWVTFLRVVFSLVRFGFIFGILFIALRVCPWIVSSVFFLFVFLCPTGGYSGRILVRPASISIWPQTGFSLSYPGSGLLLLLPGDCSWGLYSCISLGASSCSSTIAITY